MGIEFNLESSVGRGEVCVCGGAGQGATTSNSHSIARSCNAAMCRRKRAIGPVAALTQQVNPLGPRFLDSFNGLVRTRSGQLKILGSRKTPLRSRKDHPVVVPIPDVGERGVGCVLPMLALEVGYRTGLSRGGLCRESQKREKGDVTQDSMFAQMRIDSPRAAVLGVNHPRAGIPPWWNSVFPAPLHR